MYFFDYIDRTGIEGDINRANPLVKTDVVCKIMTTLNDGWVTIELLTLS